MPSFITEIQIKFLNYNHRKKMYSCCNNTDSTSNPSAIKIILASMRKTPKTCANQLLPVYTNKFTT